jgi:hypothetical protein
MKIKSSFYLLAFVFAFNAMYSCVNHDLASPFIVDCTTASAVSYEEDIQTIIINNCALPGCHNGSSSLPNWTDYETLAEHGAEVQRRITLPLSDPDKMPKTGEISPDEREKLYCWIEQGALNN